MFCIINRDSPRVCGKIPSERLNISEPIFKHKALFFLRCSLLAGLGTVKAIQAEDLRFSGHSSRMEATTREVLGQHSEKVAYPQPSALPVSEIPNEEEDEVEYFPEGEDGGWMTVVACSIVMFWVVGISNSWGVLQAALLKSGSPTSSASTLSFVGTLTNTCSILFGLLVVRLMEFVGCPVTPIIGVVIFSIGVSTAGLLISDGGSIGGLFGTYSILGGIGSCILFTVGNVVPIQFFKKKLGFASGIIRATGGLGGTVLSVAVDALRKRVGLQWTFHTVGLLMIGTGLPAAWFIRERNRVKRKSQVFRLSTLGLFKNPTFTATFFTGVINVFSIWVPVFFLPLFADAIGYSTTASAGLVSGFNVASTLGRLGFGILCDRIGSFNSLVVMTTLSTISMLAIWPVSSSLGPLVIFAIINGLASGAFFVTLPTAIASLFDANMGQIAVTVAMTGWTPGYISGAPIAAALLTKHVDIGGVMDPFYAMIFYAGGCSFLAMCCAVTARLLRSRKIWDFC